MQTTKFKQTEIGSYPEDWSESTLGELGEVIGGGTPSTKEEKYYNGDISWITPKDLSDHKEVYIAKGERSITKEGLENSSARLMPEETVLFTSRAPVGYVAIAKNPVSTNQGFKSIVCGKTLYNRFLYYWLRYNKDRIESMASGSTFKEVSGSTLKTIKIVFPAFVEQRDVAKVLFELDSQIEVLQQQNETLEAIGKAVFKHWFVDFEFPNEKGKPYRSSGGVMIDSELGLIPKGWEIKDVYSFAHIVNGAPFASNLFNQSGEGLPLIRIRDLKTTTPQFYTAEKHPKATVIQPGDIIAGMDAEFRPTIWTGERAYLNQRLFLAKPKNDYISKFYIYESLRPHLMFFENSKVGTTVIHLSKTDIDSFRFPSVPEKLHAQFKLFIDEIYDKIVVNAQQSLGLSRMRDLLLPKLMTGKIRIQHAMAKNNN